MDLILKDLLYFVCFAFAGGGARIESRTLYMLISTYSTTELPLQPSFLMKANIQMGLGMFNMWMFFVNAEFMKT